MDKWDDKEKRQLPPLEKLIIKKGQLKELIADAYAIRFVFNHCPDYQKTKIIELRNVCEKAHELFDFPTNRNDRNLIMDYIIEEMRKLNWRV